MDKYHPVIVHRSKTEVKSDSLPVFFYLWLPLEATLLICICLREALVFSEKNRDKRIYLRICQGSQRV